jgi:hypothetical protein
MACLAFRQSMNWGRPRAGCWPGWSGVAAGGKPWLSGCAPRDNVFHLQSDDRAEVRCRQGNTADSDDFETWSAHMMDQRDIVGNRAAQVEQGEEGRHRPSDNQ